MKSKGEPVETRDIECSLIDEPKIDRSTRSFNRDFIAGLAMSIKVEGLYNPIVVRPNPDKPGRFVLLQGRHRLFAVRKVLKLPTIRGTVLEGLDATRLAMAGVAENLWTRDLTKMQRLRALQIWHEHYRRSLAAADEA